MKELLIVVDYQKDFVDGALGFAGAEALDGPIARRIAAVRAGGGDVIFTMDTHGAGQKHGAALRPGPVVAHKRLAELTFCPFSFSFRKENA